jgi:hypothetical protein
MPKSERTVPKSERTRFQKLYPSSDPLELVDAAKINCHMPQLVAEAEDNSSILLN